MRTEKEKSTITVHIQTDKDPMIGQLERANKEIANLKLKNTEKDTAAKQLKL